MIAASLAIGLPETPMLVVWGLATFVLPGAVLLTAAAVPLARAERFAFAFATSLVLLTATFAACLFAGFSIAAAPLVLALVTLGAALATRRIGSHDSLGPIDSFDSHGSHRTTAAAAHGASHAGSSGRPTLPAVVLVVLTLGFLVAAVAFAPVGSVDRWWYLAYVRGYLDATTLTLSEPFLGTGQAFARFGIHPWLFGLATWSSLSGVDPVAAYERGAPVLVVLASISASHAMASELFRDAARARLCVIATMLLWSGALLPVLARAGEDKVLAASALLPLCVAAFLRSIRLEGDAAQPPGLRSSEYLKLLLAAAATAAVHTLAYAFALLALVSTAALVAWNYPSRRRAAGVAAAVLLVVALAPALSGIVVRERLAAIGAELDMPDHPVVRVHDARERLIQLPVAGYVVNPRLLLHPLSVLALVGFVLMWRGGVAQDRAAPLPRSDVAADRPLPQHDIARDRDGPLDQSARLFLVATTTVPLAIAFVPPFPALAGSVIPPWMVYRVLWLLPLAPLAVLAVDRFAQRFRRRDAVATLLLLALGLPVVADGARARLADARARMAAPEGAAFRSLVDAVASLPADAVVVAAPGLSERLPAFAARHVAAALDRSTIVFAGSRKSGEARLRARAALLSGDADAASLARTAGLRPTHAVYDPQADARPRCAAVLMHEDGYALCELAADPAGGDAGNELAPALEETVAAPSQTLATAECDDAGSTLRRDPWSAAPASVTCRIAVPAKWRASTELLLVIDANTGRAADELRIVVRHPGSNTARGHATAAVSGRRTIALRVPASAAAALEVGITSSFLPVVRAKVALAIRFRGD
ncbi:MAG: DUF6077 domain-containing protein [Candidatus Binatia bacterium]